MSLQRIDQILPEVIWDIEQRCERYQKTHGQFSKKENEILFKRKESHAHSVMDLQRNLNDNSNCNAAKKLTKKVSKQLTLF